MKTVKILRTTSSGGQTVRENETIEVSDSEAHTLVAYKAAVIIESSGDVVGKRKPKSKGLEPCTQTI